MWESPGTTIRYQIDYVTINDRFERAIKSTKTYPSTDCGSDHTLVICKLQCKFQKLKTSKFHKKLEFNALNKPEIRKEYNISIRNRFDQLAEESNAIEWENLRDVLIETAEESLPKKEKSAHKKWMTDDILKMMRKAKD